MSPSSGSSADRRRSRTETVLGWVALALFVSAVGLALFEVIPAGLGCVAAGGAVAVVALVLEYRRRQALNRSAVQVFPEVGTFGARRSPQTHTKF
jgi:FtsH-binding integral membrane protein